MTERFRDRRDAGRRLAAELRGYAGRTDVLVLALPRGGVPVAFEVAEELGAPLEVFVVRKLGLPWHEELAMGALASGGVQILDEALIQTAGVSQDQIRQVVDAERKELERQEQRYRGDRPFPDMRGKTGILVDDGLATGATMRAAVTALRNEGAAKIVVAVPVAARESCAAFQDLADEVVCAVTPPDFRAVSLWYDDFSQTSDDEVHELLESSRQRAVPPKAGMGLR